MPERLNHMAYSQHIGPSATPPDSGSKFNSISLNLHIQTEDELEAVNQFLVTLGRDVVTPRGSAPATASASPSNSAVDGYSFFDPVSLNQLGLAGMPGMSPNPGPVVMSPESGFSNHPGSGYHHGGGPTPPQNFARPMHVQPVQYNSM